MMIKQSKYNINYTLNGIKENLKFCAINSENIVQTGYH